ncbi:MAG: hypothetical protein QOH41_797 [Blastocatellia bacterium]|jgi:hypothetical protein|nr:hypothetical protein [Blastocatellia bacterium]
MSLIAWHDRLSSQFQSLHQERILNGGGPIFALEHGLSQQEVSELENDVCAYIQNYRPTDSHWLSWIVYAAELGYKYVGQEYWQTFEADTAGWRERGRGRDWIRNKFKKFEHDYGGAVPSGPWAEHFGIISHPITHAILPRDFQSQLAEVLSTIKHLFTVENLQSPKLLGELIEAHSFQQPKRFRQFVQDVEMVGLIAQALLREEEDHSSKILLPITLLRIVEDLEGVARDQLHDARHRARVTQLRGLSGHRGSRVLQSTTQASSGQDRSTIEPSLVLRRSAATSWDAFLEIPDFTSLLPQHPGWRGFLEKTRARVGRSPTWLARGKLLYGVSLIQLRACPEVGRPLLTFEDGDGTPDELARYLEKHFSFRAGATILFRIGSDGRAYQSRGLLVRPGRDYLVLSKSNHARVSPLTSRIEISCEGLFGLRLSIPKTVSKESKVLIESLGLRIAEEVAVFPVGVAAVKWDEEGYGEWLVTDEACIGIKVDHSIDRMLLELNDSDDTNLEVHPEGPGQTICLQLPPLSIGEYLLSASARASPNTEFEEIGRLQIRIREPRSWKTAINEQGALIAVFDPRNPNLEELLRGAVSVEMYGPVGHQVKVTASFFGKNATDPIGRHTLPALSLPIEPKSGRAYLARLTRRPDLQSAFDFGQSCRIDLDAGELGIFSVACEREFTPLRWVVRSNAGAYVLSLSDDSGSSETASVKRYEFAFPDRPIPIPYKKALEDYPITTAGGLYVARGSMGHCSIIFPHEITGTVRSFADMGRTIIEPTFRSQQLSIEKLEEALAIFRLWTEARTTGSMMALLARQRLLRAYTAHMFGMIGGSQWARAETSYQSNPSSAGAVQKLSRAVTDLANIRQHLEHQYQRMKDASPEEHAGRLAEILGTLINRVPATGGVGRYRVLSKSSRWQAEFALRLASAPETLDYWTHDWCPAGLKGLIGNQLLARAARFIVLTISNDLQSTDRNQQSSLYAGWEWT